jgi:predicted NBD/HSP70 family sugar kinase
MQKAEPGKKRKPDAAVTLVDIGGTKELILVMGVDAKGGLMMDSVLAAYEIRTPVGKVNDFFDKTAKAIILTQTKVTDGVPILPIVCVGTPGRLVKGVIQPGSAANLGSHPHLFDGVKPAKELSDRLGAKVYAGNDAIAQMCYGLETLFTDKAKVKALGGRKVCYIGPGTGTGGGFCTVKKDLTLDIYTDGHIYDILVPGYDGRVVFPFKCDGRELSAELPYERAKLEDLLSGRAIRQIACAIERTVLAKGVKLMFLPAHPDFGFMGSAMLSLAIEHENGNSPITAQFLRETFLKAEAQGGVIQRAKPVVMSIFEFEGMMLGRLIECIHTGNITKYLEDAQWSKRDKGRVKGTADYLIGGSVGTRGVGGRIIQENALEYLRGKFPEVDFRLHPILSGTAYAGAFGAFMFADRKTLVREVKKSHKTRRAPNRKKR